MSWQFHFNILILKSICFFLQINQILKKIILITNQTYTLTDTLLAKAKRMFIYIAKLIIKIVQISLPKKNWKRKNRCSVAKQKDRNANYYSGLRILFNYWVSYPRNCIDILISIILRNITIIEISEKLWLRNSLYLELINKLF